MESAVEALADTINLNPFSPVPASLTRAARAMSSSWRRRSPSCAARPSSPPGPSGESAEPKERPTFSDFSSGEIAFAYCTEFICGRENPKEPALLRTFLESLGDCVVVVDDDEIIKVHVHTNVPGTVLTER